LPESLIFKAKPSQALQPSRGLQVQVVSGLNYLGSTATFKPPGTTIRGLTDAGTWWTAGQPILPVAPASTAPRGWQYLSEQNKIYTPRATEQVTFDYLRALSMYPFAAMCIVMHGDIVASRKWKIRLRNLPGSFDTQKQREEAEKKDPTIWALTNFWMQPNPDNTWREFIRIWMHECQVTDAPAIYIRRDLRGIVRELRIMDGAMIARLIDDNGWTPTNESPAYQQNWWGTPSWDLRRDQLFYRPMNPRVYKLYGWPATERGRRWIELGMGRLELRLQWVENGSIPDGLMVVPRDAPVDLIERQQAWMNSVMAGNLAKRVQLRLIQGFTQDGKDQIIFPKEKMLTDDYDEFEIRMLCGIYGVSKQRFLQQMNRASAEIAQEAAEEEGTWPSEQYVMDSVNLLIQSPLYFNLPKYEFVYEDDREKDPVAQMTADTGYFKVGLKTDTEVRDGLGLDPYTPEQNPDTGKAVIVGPTGAILFGQAPAQTAGEGNKGPEGEVLPPTGKKPPKPKKFGKIVDAEFLEDFNHDQIERFLQAAKSEQRFDKTTPGMSINPHHYSLQGENAKKNLQDKIAKKFDKVCTDLVSKIKKVTAKKVHKSDEDDINKLLGDDDFWSSLWIDLPPDIVSDLEDAIRAGMAKGLLEADVHISQADVINSFNQLARNEASERAAEMVGMKWSDDGELVPNPKAQYVISETTREDLRRIITNAFEKNTPLEDIVAEIEDAGSFSQIRAQMIARTEVSRAQAGGTYSVWKQTGVVKTVIWQHSNMPNVCDNCVANAEQGEIEFGKAFQSGDLYPPAHPNCRCVVVAKKTVNKAATAA